MIPTYSTDSIVKYLILNMLGEDRFDIILQSNLVLKAESIGSKNYKCEIEIREDLNEDYTVLHIRENGNRSIQNWETKKFNYYEILKELKDSLDYYTKVLKNFYVPELSGRDVYLDHLINKPRKVSKYYTCDVYTFYTLLF